MGCCDVIRVQARWLRGRENDHQNPANQQTITSQQTNNPTTSLTEQHEVPLRSLSVIRVSPRLSVSTDGIIVVTAAS